MKLYKKICAALLVGAISISFSGCTYNDKTVYFDTNSGRNTVFKIGDMKCSKKEALTYLLNEKNIYGSVDGVNLWTEDFDTDTMTGSIKDLTMEHLTRVFVLNLYAEEHEIVLTETEQKACQDAAKEYYSSLNSAEKSFTGASKKDIAAMYEKYVLAMKVYRSLMDSVDEEVSEDESRVMEAFVLFVSDKEKANEIQGMIDYGYTFERLASTYTELDSYQVTFARGEYPDEVDKVVFNLDTDEVSTAISADGGYYFFQCLDKYNEELSEANKQVIIDNRRKQVLNDIVTDLEERYFSDMNTKLWDEISFPEDVSELTSASFFKTLNDNL
ncbi:peptidylprolyl isomerase [Pseudobutyrivibrio xylanivorans]|uniref:peptidylprolyl isomerase n=1 Tax=Pseudobutyrivibrio xylanivorans TaxID=185007 RepID=A0A5P6VP82_PSEXY|nr:peptidyl-prolyl cis-trans isomerase [Pseudobutyrivibrio xylanivorans]QFJ53499.1 peptidyl-prolyl cis-trans isomerase [Pseudobutyrivibrio xylanivorans]